MSSNRAAASRRARGANWSQTGSYWSLSGNTATSPGSNAAGTESLWGPILPGSSCYWVVDITNMHGGFCFLGVARSNLMPANWMAAGYTAQYSGAAMFRDGSNVGGADAITAGVYRIAVRTSNNSMYIQNITSGGSIYSAALPAGYSASLLRPLILPQGGYAAPSARLFAAALGSGGLY